MNVFCVDRKANQDRAWTICKFQLLSDRMIRKPKSVRFAVNKFNV